VTSPKVTALLGHDAYVVVIAKVMQTEGLNEFQLRPAIAVSLFEENCSYIVIAKEPDRSKAWVEKWARHWTANQTASLRMQSCRRLANKTALDLIAQKLFAVKLGQLENTLKGKQ